MLRGSPAPGRSWFAPSVGATLATGLDRKRARTVAHIPEAAAQATLTLRGADPPLRAVVYLLPGGDADVLTLAAGLGDDFRFEMLDHGWERTGLQLDSPAAILVSSAQAAGAKQPLMALVKRAGPPVLALLQPDDLETADVYGGADFAICPGRTPEVAVRLRRLTGSGPRPEPGLMWGALRLDEERHEATANGGRLDLTYTEFRLLALLMTLRGRVVTRERAYKDIWETERHFGGLRTVDVHIRRLRSKIEAHGCAYITTVRNVGYRLRDL